MIACCCSILASVYYYNNSNTEEEDVSTIASAPVVTSVPSSTNPSTYPKLPEYKGHYTRYVEGGDERGDAACIDTAKAYNLKNENDPYIGYSIRGPGHDNNIKSSCIYYKQSFMDDNIKTEPPLFGKMIVTKCLNPAQYPDNWCNTNPLSGPVTGTGTGSGNRRKFDGYYDSYIDGETERGEDACINVLNTYNTANPQNPYVAYSVRGANHSTSLTNSCMYYKRPQLNESYKRDTSKTYGGKFTTACVDPTKDPSNRCM